MLTKFAPVRGVSVKPAAVQVWEMLHWSLRLLATPNDYRTYRLYRRGVTRSHAQRFVSGVRARTAIWPLNADIEVLEDKRRFEEHFVGLSMPKTLAIIDPSGSGLHSTELRIADETVAFLTERLDAGVQLAVKMLDSMQGLGVVVLAARDGEEAVLSTGERRPIRAVVEDILSRGGTWLVQERLEQHPVLNALNSSSLNTVRLGTFYRADGTVDIEYAVLRIGRRSSQVDAFAGGGIAVTIDPLTGELAADGSQKAKYAVEPVLMHPDSGINFAGIVLPFWSDLCDIARAFAQRTPENRYVGWDIAITPEGPVMIEGNHNWDVALPQAAGTGLLTDEFVDKMRAETQLIADPRKLPPLRPITAWREYRHDHR